MKDITVQLTAKLRDSNNDIDRLLAQVKELEKEVITLRNLTIELNNDLNTQLLLNGTQKTEIKSLRAH